MGEDIKNTVHITAEIVEAGWKALTEYPGDNKAILVTCIYLAMQEKVSTK